MASEAEVERADSGMEPPGARLRAGREAAGLKLADVALELRLSVDTIDALEHGAADKLPAPIFVRGYVRNYAVLVGLPPQELVEAYNSSVGGVQNQGLRAGPMQQQLVGARRRNYLVWLLVLVVAVAAGWWFQQRTASPPGRTSITGQTSAQNTDQAQAPPAAASSAGEPNQGEIPPAVQPGQSMQPGSSAAETPAAIDDNMPPQAEPVVPPPDDVGPPGEDTAAVPTPSEPASPTAAAPPPAAPQSSEAVAGDTLTLAFTDRSWVEVRDAAGQRLLYRLANAGETRTVQGKPPFRLVLGNAPAVRVELNGKPVDVASHTKGRTARFSVAP